MTASEAKTTIQVFLHQWTDINAEQYRDHVSCERAGSNWSDHPKTLTVPAGWHTAKSQGDSLELYTDKNEHVTFVRIGSHRKSVEVAGSFGIMWLAMSDAESVCCPTCGHPL